MRQLLPFPCDPVDLAALYGDLPSARTRPAVRLNMIASIDGATAIAGVSGGLGGPADQALFAVLRRQADVVLVAAGTVRAEHYGPLDVPVALGALAERGYARVLAEGGPTLNGQLVAAGLLDELCLTVSPLLAGGDAKRILAGPALPSGPGWQIRSLCEQDGFLFLRYRRPQ